MKKKHSILVFFVVASLIFNSVNLYAANGVLLSASSQAVDSTLSLKVETKLTYYSYNNREYPQKLLFKWTYLKSNVYVTGFTIRMTRSGNYYIGGTGTRNAMLPDIRDYVVTSSDMPYLRYDSDGYTPWNYPADNRYFAVDSSECAAGTYIYAGEVEVKYTVNGVAKTWSYPCSVSHGRIDLT